MSFFAFFGCECLGFFGFFGFHDGGFLAFAFLFFGFDQRGVFAVAFFPEFVRPSTHDFVRYGAGFSLSGRRTCTAAPCEG